MKRRTREPLLGRRERPDGREQLVECSLNLGIDFRLEPLFQVPLPKVERRIS